MKHASRFLAVMVCAVFLAGCGHGDLALLVEGVSSRTKTDSAGYSDYDRRHKTLIEFCAVREKFPNFYHPMDWSEEIRVHNNGDQTETAETWIYCPENKYLVATQTRGKSIPGN